MTYLSWIVGIHRPQYSRIEACLLACRGILYTNQWMAGRAAYILSTNSGSTCTVLGLHYSTPYRAHRYTHRHTLQLLLDSFPVPIILVRHSSYVKIHTSFFVQSQLLQMWFGHRTTTQVKLTTGIMSLCYIECRCYLKHSKNLFNICMCFHVTFIT